MEQPDLLTRVKEMIAAEFKIPVDDVTTDTKLTDLGADSLDVVELVMDFEEEFAVEIPDNLVDERTTVGDLVSLIQQQRAAAETAPRSRSPRRKRPS